MQTLVIASTLDTLGYLTPVSSSVLQLSHDQLVVLLPCPVTFDDVRVKDNVPSLMALLLSSATNVISNFPPILRTVDSHCLSQFFIFLLCPVSLDKHRITHLLPSVLALVSCTTLHHLGYLLPVSDPTLLHSSLQLFVLLFIPEASPWRKFTLGRTRWLPTNFGICGFNLGNWRI